MTSFERGVPWYTARSLDDEKPARTFRLVINLGEKFCISTQYSSGIHPGHRDSVSRCSQFCRKVHCNRVQLFSVLSSSNVSLYHERSLISVFYQECDATNAYTWRFKVTDTKTCYGTGHNSVAWGGVTILLHLPRCTITSNNTANAYNKGYAIKITRNVMHSATSKAS
jgi:hypothetical protein